jgi:PAS domain-containing protein
MFRVKESEEIHGFSKAERVVQITLLLGFLANLGSVYLIFQDHRRLSAWLDGPEAVPAQALGSLRQDVGLQLVGSLAVAAIVAFCLAAMWWLPRRSFSSQRSLRQIKMLAHDILASMDRGVVTTNREGIITSINSAAIGLLEVDFE